MGGFRQLLDLEKTPFARPYSDAEYDLPRFRAWVDSLGAPDRGLAFLHIAGTKGKGSTAAISEAILRAHGLRTGMFTSPHLAHFGERIRINGEAYSAARFDEACAAFDRQFPDAVAPSSAAADFRTVFEYLTALALVEFAREGVDVVAWETGLGGRIDCTNIVDPTVCAITAIGIDHTKLLGTTIESIAREKAGILKPGRSAVIQRQPFAAVYEMIAARAAEIGLPATMVHRAEELCEVVESTPTVAGQRARARMPSGEIAEIELPLHGAHQARNLETAIGASALFLEARGRRLDVESTVRGAESARWAGRFDVRTNGAGVLVLDGAHCPMSAECLRASLAEWSANSGALAPYALVMGMQADKDAAGFLAALFSGGKFARAEFYTVPGGRGADGSALAEIATRLGVSSTVHAEPAAALEAARASALTVVSTGTLYTIDAFGKQFAGK